MKVWTTKHDAEVRRRIPELAIEFSAGGDEEGAAILSASVDRAAASAEGLRRALRRAGADEPRIAAELKRIEGLASGHIAVRRNKNVHAASDPRSPRWRKRSA